MNSLKCQQCGHENDLTRVFCQDCGARLERPAGATPAAPPPLVTSGPGSRLAQKPKTDGGGAANFVWSLIKLVILAAILAAVIQMFRMPTDLPPPPPPGSSVQAGVLQRMIDSAAQSPGSISIGVEEAALNAYLASKLKAAPSGGNAEFQRMFIVFDPGTIKLGMQQKVFDWPIAVQMYAVPVRTGGIWDLRVTGGQIGRLPIHPALVLIVQRFFAPAGNALQPDISKLSKVSSIEIKKGQAVLTWP